MMKGCLEKLILIWLSGGQETSDKKSTPNGVGKQSTDSNKAPAAQKTSANPFAGFPWAQDQTKLQAKDKQEAKEQQPPKAQTSQAAPAFSLKTGGPFAFGASNNAPFLFGQNAAAKKEEASTSSKQPDSGKFLSIGAFTLGIGTCVSYHQAS